MGNVAIQPVVGTFDSIDIVTPVTAIRAIYNVHSKIADCDPFGDSRRIAFSVGGMYALERVIWLCEHAAGASKVLYDTHALAVKALARGEI